MSVVLPADKRAAAPEIAVYLKESVGNSTRIDYGTGNGALCHLSYQLALIGYVATGSFFPPQIKVGVVAPPECVAAVVVVLQ